LAAFYCNKQGRVPRLKENNSVAVQFDKDNKKVIQAETPLVIQSFIVFPVAPNQLGINCFVFCASNSSCASFWDPLIYNR
jgi:hypothetical protein